MDDDERIAVTALGDMRNSNPDPDFVYRVSHIPIVNTAIKAYEHGKASSRVVKYGAEIVESSVISISRPVIDRLPDSLDDFACRQLDRLYPAADSSSRSPTPTTDQQVVQRSRWQAVLLEAGGLSAALSEESMRRLKYCLQWLQYATAHIDAQILILRDFVAALQPLPHTHPHPAPAPARISPAHMHTLAAVRRDVVHTIREVVDVVSKYAGGALPEPARTRVRGFILRLPQSWAAAAAPARAKKDRGREEGVAGGRKGKARTRHAPGASNPVSPSASPRLARAGDAAQEPTAGTALHAAQRLLALATESLDMMRGVTGVVRDSLDRADVWVGRLGRPREEGAPSSPSLTSASVSLSASSVPSTPYSEPGTPAGEEVEWPGEGEKKPQMDVDG